MIGLALCITELEIGGAERRLVELATQIDRQRFTPVVYSLGPRPEPGRDALVRALKYGGRLVIARLLGEALAQTVAAELADLIVPMPLSVQRLRERGFNQALEIARPVARATGIPLAPRACRRTKSIVSRSPMASATPIPPGIQIKSRAGQVTKVQVGKRLRPQSLGTGASDLATMCIAA